MRRISSLFLCVLTILVLFAPSCQTSADAVSLISVAGAADDNVDPAADMGEDVDLDDLEGDDLDIDEDVADVEDEEEDGEDGSMDEDEDDDDMGDDEEDSGPAPEDDPDKPAVLDPAGDENASDYAVPEPLGATFFDDFQSGLAKWTHTNDAEYMGKFATGQGAKPTFRGDRALIIPEKARKYGMSAVVSGLESMTDKSFVLQYEVKLEQGMTCGGAYVKLPRTDFDPKELTGSTPYSIMFGPDKCGSTDKVHFIFQSLNPKTNKLVEHHLKNPPSVANTFDKKTHLYTLIVNSDATFEVLVDNEKKSHGSLSDKFDPPVQPEKEVDDPEDKKPADWVDEKKIKDPDAKKPDDWDEDAPAQIPDEDAVKPEGWLDDEPEKVADPDAKKPDEWDDDEDGEWEAPMIANPKCEKVGCGLWTRPMKANPAFKGKWKAPMIDNPKYIGDWKPRKIANPDYYELSKPELLGIGGVAFEIWTMDQGVLFDNLWIGTDVEAARKFANETFGKKQVIEMAAEEKEREESAKKSKKSKKSRSVAKGKLGPVMDKFMDAVDKMEELLEPLEIRLQKMGLEPYLDRLIDMGVQKPMVLVVSIPIFLTLIFLIVIGFKKKPSSEESSLADSSISTEAEKKKTDEITEDTPADEAVEPENIEKAGELIANDDDKSGLRHRTPATEDS